jgi:dTMP kinase
MPDIEYPYLPASRSFLYVGIDDPYMRDARDYALKHSLDEAVKTGSVVVRNGEVIGRGANGSDYHTLHGCERVRHGIPTGHGYELCEGCRPKNHSEPRAIADAQKNGHDPIGADLYLWGHWWCCEPCWNAMIEAGIENVYLLEGSERLFNKASPENIIGRQFAREYNANTMVHGTLIDIEGGDGSGKATQAKLLAERLRAEGEDVALFSFPRYETSRTGKLIGELLSGVHGDFMSTPPYVSALPYALDRAGAKGEIVSALGRGALVICDRYTPSNLAHQSAKLPKDEQPALVAFIEGLEYEDLGLPRPSLVIYLSVPTDTSSELVLKKEARGYIKNGEARDHAERNVAHQDRTRAAYLKLAKERGWQVVDCAPGRSMRAPEDIHEEIWKIVEKRLVR